MYGLVNIAIQNVITNKFGNATWERIKDVAEIDTDTFSSLEAYPDSVTYGLVGAASVVLDVSGDELLESFGEHWGLYSGQADTAMQASCP
jgi:hypothetical protein